MVLQLRGDVPAYAIDDEECVAGPDVVRIIRSMDLDSGEACTVGMGPGFVPWMGQYFLHDLAEVLFDGGGGQLRQVREVRDVAMSDQRLKPMAQQALLRIESIDPDLAVAAEQARTESGEGAASA